MNFTLRVNMAFALASLEPKMRKIFSEFLKEDHRQDIGADGFYNCPQTGDEVAIDWFL